MPERFLPDAADLLNVKSFENRVDADPVPLLDDCFQSLGLTVDDHQIDGGRAGFEAGSDIANMAVLGYSPEKYYTGRGPLEALSMGVDLAPDDMAYRCNLVMVEGNTMADFSAGHISSAEGKELFASLQKTVPEVLFKAGVSYRNLLVIHGGEGASSTPPHDIVRQGISPFLPKGGDADLLLRCMVNSRQVFEDHPVNKARIMAGKRPATQIWPWSGGRKPAFPPFTKKYGKRGGIISAVDLLNGIARCAGMEVISVPGLPAISTPITRPRHGTRSMPSIALTLSTSILKRRTRPDIWEALRRR